VGRASRRGSGKRKSADVWWKMVMLIYPYLEDFMQKKINNYLRESNRSHERVNLKTSFRLNGDIFKGFFLEKVIFVKKFNGLIFCLAGGINLK
jgi:hypothetical protein